MIKLACLAAVLSLLSPSQSDARDCDAATRACREDCDRRIGADREAALAGCRARCATDSLACEAEGVIRHTDRAAREEVVPELRRRIDQLRDLLDGFRREGDAPQRLGP
jgi:hypothetical protein